MNGISFWTSRTVRNTVVVRISGVSAERGSTVFSYGVGGKSCVLSLAHTHRIVVCVIGWGKRVFCACIPGAVNYYISAAN